MSPLPFWYDLRSLYLRPPIKGLEGVHQDDLLEKYWARDKDGRKVELTGLIAVHVDDLIVTGAATFKTALTKMKGKLSFGKWYVKEFDNLGRHVKQAEGFTIRISQPGYAGRVPGVPISKAELQPVSEATRADLRRTAGALASKV